LQQALEDGRIPAHAAGALLPAARARQGARRGTHMSCGAQAPQQTCGVARRPGTQPRATYAHARARARLLRLKG
jgi:hypothetical protein